MREAHAHIFPLGEALSLPDLSRCGSAAELLERVREAAGERDGRRPGFVRMSGARTAAWSERRWPSLAELDAASGGVPVVIMSFDHHQAMANTAAMQAGGLAPGVRVPPKGTVEVDPGTGEATGVLMEHAAYRAWESAPAPSAGERRGMLLAALRHLAKLGFTEVHDLNSPAWLGPALAELRGAGEWPVERVRLFAPAAEIERACAERGAWESSDGSLALAGAKVFSDGTLNSGTALMLEPYREPVSQGLKRGQAMVSGRELDEAIAGTRRLGVGLAVHAIGDGAVRMVLDAWERSGAKGWSGREDTLPPLRIEHCELIDERDVPRFARMGVVCSVQPCHLLADIEVLRRQMPDRLERVLPLRELIDSGCVPGRGGLLWFGSDVPIVRADPGDSVLAAVKRRRAGMPEAEAIGLRQAIGEDEAWAAFGGKAAGVRH